MAKKEAEGGNKKVIIIAVVAVLLIAAVAAGAVAYVMMNNSSNEEVFLYDMGEPFTTNLQSPDSLVKASITVAYTDEKAAEDIEKNSAVIRDTIVFILRSKTTEQMNALDIKTTLSNEICQKLNSDLGVIYFNHVYFSDFVVQS